MKQVPLFYRDLQEEGIHDFIFYLFFWHTRFQKSSLLKHKCSSISHNFVCTWGYMVNINNPILEQKYIATLYALFKDAKSCRMFMAERFLKYYLIIHVWFSVKPLETDSYNSSTFKHNASMTYTCTNCLSHND